MRVWPLASVVLVLVVLASAATGEQRRRRSTSVGITNDGTLLAGARLPKAAPGLFSNPERPNKEAFWGTDELVEAIVRAAADVERREPGAKLYVNDLSVRDGGRIAHHSSHQSGRDADLLFYALDPAGKVAAPRCVRFDPQGKGIWHNNTRSTTSDDEPLVFDARRNWLVVRALAENAGAGTQRIFVAETIRTLLLEHAQSHGEPGWLIERAGDLMCEPETPHDDHFHVRVFCSADDYRAGCRDTWPLFPWRRTELAGLGLIDPELRTARQRRGAKATKTSGEPAKRPGRTWCP